MKTIYKSITREADKPNKEEELTNKILQKYSNQKNTTKYVKKQDFIDNELTDYENLKLNQIMAKYNK